MKACNVLDFDDLILLPTLLLQRNEEVRERWQNKIRYLLVDEYQDTNTSQYELVKLLVGQRRVLPWWAMMTSRSTPGAARGRRTWCCSARTSRRCR
jgi:superfamily I DNA/RNA helicase